MADENNRSGPDLGLHQAQPARMYDYMLGGKDNYDADREAVEKIERLLPSVRRAARTNRDFMIRAARFVAQAGIRQFLDIGTGIPTEPNLHQTVQQIAPDARVVYVDNDPIVLTHARALLVGTPEGRTGFIPADVRDPETILDAPILREILDLERPVALSLIALMHFIDDDEHPYDIVNTLMNALAPGSYLVMTHITGEFTPDIADRAVQIYRDSGITFRLRDRGEFTRFFDGLDLIDPGIETPHRWHPDGIVPPRSMDKQMVGYAGVARKPGGPTR
ncbi:SAM-dependent methyltransferase [Nocardia thraciensis]